MADIDNDGEHKTSDKDDLQVLKVWISYPNAVVGGPGLYLEKEC